MTKYIAFNKLKDELTIPSDLMSVDATRHLELTLDTCLSWNEHVDQSKFDYVKDLQKNEN